MMLALALTGVAGAGYAQTTGTSPAPAASAQTATAGTRHWHRHHGMLGVGMMMHTLHQLNLTDAQKQSVKQILVNARAQFETQRQSAGAPNFAALSNPGDPNHAAALQDLQTRMSARIQARDQIQQQIYGVLTDQQKSQFASILAARQAKMAQHDAS